MSIGYQGLLAKRWRVYNQRLRSQFQGRIIEIQTICGETVVNWQGFDALDLSKTERMDIARAIVRGHNSLLQHPPQQAEKESQ